MYKFPLNCANVLLYNNMLSTVLVLVPGLNDGRLIYNHISISTPLLFFLKESTSSHHSSSGRKFIFIENLNLFIRSIASRWNSSTRGEGMEPSQQTPPLMWLHLSKVLLANKISQSWIRVGKKELQSLRHATFIISPEKRRHPGERERQCEHVPSGKAENYLFASFAQTVAAKPPEGVPGKLSDERHLKWLVQLSKTLPRLQIQQFLPTESKDNSRSSNRGKYLTFLIEICIMKSYCDVLYHSTFRGTSFPGKTRGWLEKRSPLFEKSTTFHNRTPGFGESWWWWW